MSETEKYISDLIHLLRKDGPVIFLESQKKDHPASKKSYLAAKPVAWIKSDGSKISLWEKGEENTYDKNPWDALNDFVNKYRDWTFGYLGYDLKNYVEDLSSENDSKVSAPEMFFMIPGLLLEISELGRIKVLKGNLPEEVVSQKKQTNLDIHLKNRIEKEEYLEKIKKAQKHIQEGDFYEVNLSHALEFEFEGDEFELYKRMREFGPVPFASFIKVDGISICCASPERFLSKAGNKVWSQPIKGTVSRNAENEDERWKSLLQSEKNKAENLMIVDLVRNDLGKIAKKGSVQVKNLFEIQSFETVHQMVSTVECEVAPSVNLIELIKACFPMGSMTGAPKISAMKAIEELEDYKRGIYSGAIGYFTPWKDFDFNVVIRTAMIEDDKLVYPVGGAITSDSVPEEEWEETLVKAKALTITLD